MLQFTAFYRPLFNRPQDQRILATGEINAEGVVTFSNFLPGELPREETKTTITRALARYRIITNGQCYNIWNPNTGITIETR